MNAAAATKCWIETGNTHSEYESAQLWNDWRTCELSDAFSWLFNSVAGCLAIDSEGWLAAGGSRICAGRCVCTCGACTSQRGMHAFIMARIPSCCRGICRRAAKWNVRPGITAIAVVLMQCHTMHTQSHSSTLLHLCVCVCMCLFSGLVSVHRGLNCRHISVYMGAMCQYVYCCRQGLCFVLMKWAQLLACSKWIISAETQLS